LNQQDEVLAGNHTPLLSHYKKTPALTNRSIFRIKKDELSMFFEKRNIKKPDNEGETRISLQILRDCGYNPGLCRLLNSDPETGIVGDPADLSRRQEIFGKHSIAIPTITPMFTIMARQFEDSNVIFLTQAATLYLFVSLFGNDKGDNAFAYIMSLTIYAGLLFACSLAGICDYIKERQHLSLKDEINNQKVTVYRGAFGTVQSVPVKELVVGDIVDINQGDRVPADCILIDEMNITVDQSMY